MWGRFHRRWLVALLLGGMGGAVYGLPVAVAQPPGGETAASGLLVLRNGNVLRGSVLRLADHYRVRMPHGQMQVPVDQVEMFCHNLDEAYERRRRNRTGRNADSHLELARWCLRHELLGHAARELLDIRTMDPGHRQLPMLERQLRQALRQSHPKRPQPVAAHKPTALPPEVDRKALKHAPPRDRALFVRKIQPLLIHSCATTGCHQPNSSSSFQLNRFALDGQGHPDTTLRNLAATLAYVDWQAPEQSTLLERARSAHGAEQASQSHALQARKYHLLQSWIEQLAVDDPTRAAAELPVNSEGRPEKSPGEMQPSGLRPVDPFDPEIFNRRVAARSEAEVESGARDNARSPSREVKQEAE